MVKCRIGEEKVTLLQLMRKFIAYQFSDKPLQVQSIVAPEHVKGYIYVEAYKQTHVKQIIEGIGNLRLGRYKQQVGVILVGRETHFLMPEIQYLSFFFISDGSHQ